MTATAPAGGALARRAFRRLRRDRTAMICLAVLAAYAATGGLTAAGLLAQDWAALSGQSRAGPSLEHPFGTTVLGQDILARALYSTRTAFEIGLVVAVLSTVLGAILGGLAGYFRGSLADETVLWLKGVIDSIPFYLLVAAVAWALRDSPFAMHVAMVATFWTTTGRLVRGEVARLREHEFVLAARAVGRPPLGILFRHVLPNTGHILLVQGTIAFVAAIKAEVILSFLGLGVREGISWGRMIDEAATDVMHGHLGNFLAASILMFGLVLAVSLLADALQDALDPRQWDGGR